MNRLLAALPIVAACEGGPFGKGGTVELEDSAGTEELSPCDLEVSIDSICPTDACPAIATSDVLIDLRTSVKASVENIGGTACVEAEADLALNWMDKETGKVWGPYALSTQVVPALASGETATIFDDTSEFHDRDFDYDEPSLAITLDPSGTLGDDASNNSDEGALPYRTGVGCMVRAHALEKIEEAQGIFADGARCTEAPFDDVKIQNPYCWVVTEGKKLGWVAGSADTKDVDSDDDRKEIVMDGFTCANHADGSTMLARAYELTLPPATFPCRDVTETSTEWYRDAINAVELATDALTDADGNCNPEKELTRPVLENALDRLGD